LSDARIRGQVTREHPQEAVCLLRLSNPSRRNALDHDLLAALATELRDLAADGETRCVILIGEPPAFSSGYDLASIRESHFERDAAALIAHPFQPAMEEVSRSPLPIIAAINGHCLGGGLELAVRCDIRICARGAELGMPPARLGLIYGHTGVRRFLDLIGVAWTKELFLVGNHLDAGTAERIGLVNRVVDDEEVEAEALALAAKIAANAPLAVAGNKSVIDLLAENPRLDERQEAELLALRRSCFAGEFREGMRAFREKTRPDWRAGRSDRRAVDLPL